MFSVQSLLLYGEEFLASATLVVKYDTQRQGALRIACSYRTVLELTVLVLASVIPLDLLAQERKFFNGCDEDLDRVEVGIQARAQMMAHMAAEV